MEFYEAPISARLFDLQNKGDPVLEYERDYFLERIAQTNGPVLDLGCGTGRILLPALEQDADIHGCDKSQAFLDRLHSKATQLDLDTKSRTCQCDLEDTDFSINIGANKFALAFAAFRTFDHLVSDGARQTFLRECAKLLRPDGQLILNLANPEPLDLHAAQGQKVLMRDDLYDDETDMRVVWWGVTQFNPETNHINEACQYDLIASDGRIHDSYYFPFTMRWTPATEMEEIVAESEFETEEKLGGFNEEEFQTGTGDSLWVLRKK